MLQKMSSDLDRLGRVVSQKNTEIAALKARQAEIQTSQQVCCFPSERTLVDNPNGTLYTCFSYYEPAMNLLVATAVSARATNKVKY